MRVPLIVVLLLGLGGCAQMQSWFGGDSAQQRQAQLQQSARIINAPVSRRLWVADRDDAESVVVAAVDTVSTYSYWRGVFGSNPYLSEVLLAPGPHTLLVRYRDAIFYGDGELSLDAEAGRTYRLQKQTQGLSLQLWIEDDQGRRISSSGRDLTLTRRE